jgi:hypothetical protein
LRIDGAGESGNEILSDDDGGGPVNIQRSFTRERLLVSEIDVKREKECVSKEERRERICCSESVANVSS